MIDPTNTPTPPEIVQPAVKFEDYVRQHPGTALLAAAGLGLAAVLVARALAPAPPRSRAVLLLEDIRHRLADLAQQGYDRVAGLAEDGAHAVVKGVDGLGDLHLDRKFDRFSRGLKSLFQS